MPISFPPDLVLREFLGSTTRHARRIEIYEQDGVTRWEKDTVGRLKGGQVTVDYSRDERRAIDLTLSNDDGVLINAPGEFWYDKIIKVFRGVLVNEPTRVPRILVLSDKTGLDQMSQSFRGALVDAGFGDIQVNTLASDYKLDVERFDIIVGLGSGTSTQTDLLVEAYRAGKSVFVQDSDAIAWVADAYSASAAVTTNVAPNPDFTTGTTGWVIPPANGTLTWDSTKQAAQINYNGTTGTVFYTNAAIPAIEADIYTTSFLVENSGATSATLMARLIGYATGDAATIITGPVTVLAPGETKTITITGPIGGRAVPRTSMRPSIAFNPGSAATILVHWNKTEQVRIAPVATSAHPVSKGWSAFTATTKEPTTAYTYSTPDATLIAPVTDAGTSARIAAFTDPVSRGRAVVLSLSMEYQQYEDENFQAFLASAFTWLNTVVPLKVWEVQIGEFMIDRITEPHFPHEVQITGRDYTKKCLKSKFTRATQFIGGMTLESLIGSIAANAGITKRLMPATGIVVGKSFFYERGTSRWEAMKDIADAYNHELYFDAQGYLVLRPYRDPAVTAPVVYIETGREGQMASYKKSTSDARLYNHVIVTGESSDPATVPVWGEAINTDPNSPTNVNEIGDRLYQYVSSFITTMQQAQDVADSFLAVHDLEEFELDFETLMLPWLEVGDIIGWKDPNPAPDDPSTFLLSSITIPLGLGPMSGMGRRVSNVGA